MGAGPSCIELATEAIDVGAWFDNDAVEAECGFVRAPIDALFVSGSNATMLLEPQMDARRAMKDFRR